jgi:hypothetical protein
VQRIKNIVDERVKCRAGRREFVDIAAGAEGAAFRREKYHARLTVQHTVNSTPKRPARSAREEICPRLLFQYDPADVVCHGPSDGIGLLHLIVHA